MRLVHHKTVIQTVFAVQESDDEQIPQPPIVAEVHRFTPEAFLEAHQMIADARDQAKRKARDH